MLTLFQRVLSSLDSVFRQDLPWVEVRDARMEPPVPVTQRSMPSNTRAPLALAAAIDQPSCHSIPTVVILQYESSSFDTG